MGTNYRKRGRCCGSVPMSILDWYRKLPVALSPLYVVSILKGTRLEYSPAHHSWVVANNGSRKRGRVSVLVALDKQGR
jgi:hypothetical protein